MAFKNLKELEKYVNKMAKQALQQKESNVKNVVVYELRQSIEENVYSHEAYDKTQAKEPYIRAREHGGLIDSDNFVAEPTVDGVAIYSTREGKDRSENNVYVAEIIEGYKEYSVMDQWGYGFESPRHFVEPAREELRKGKHLKKALALDMQDLGLDVEVK